MPNKVEIKEKKENKVDKEKEEIKEEKQQQEINEEEKNEDLNEEKKLDLNGENQNKDLNEENKSGINEENKDVEEEKEISKTEEEKEIEDKKEETNEEREKDEEKNENEQKEEINQEKEKEEIVNGLEESNDNDTINQPNETVEKIKRLFESIKNFDQLKKEVYEMRKHYELLNQLTIKNFEEREQNNLANFNQKISDLNKKFELLLGDLNPNDLEKNDSEFESFKPMNISEINTRLRAYQYSKANVTDLNSLNDEYDFRIKELSRRFDDFKISIFGPDIDDINKGEEQNNQGNSDTNRSSSRISKLNFISKADFEKFKIKSEEEFRKIWEEISNLKLHLDDFNNKINNKATLEDLENLKNIILEKTEELFLNQNKKYVNFSSTIKILQDNFKKLLKILSDKEQYYENGQYQMENNPMSIGGHSCASCETYIGDLRSEQKFVSWNKFPKKEKDSDILKRVQNGYSRLLQMINFDSNGNPSFNPYTSSINNETNISSNVEDNTLATKEKSENNQSFSNKRLFSTKVKKLSKETNKTIDVLNSKKENLNKNKRLPSIKPSKSIDNLQKLKYKSNQNEDKKDINFINPAISQIVRNSEEKNN